MLNAPTASHSLTVRLQILNKPGMLGKVTSAIGKGGGDIGGIDLVEVGRTTITRDITFKASDERHGQAGRRAAARASRASPVVNVSDRTFLMHLGGKIEVQRQDGGEDARRPLDGLHAGRGARLHGHPRTIRRRPTRSRSSRTPWRW